MPGVGTLYCLAIRKQGGEDRYTIYRPNTGRAVSDKMGWQCGPSGAGLLAGQVNLRGLKTARLVFELDEAEPGVPRADVAAAAGWVPGS